MSVGFKSRKKANDFIETISLQPVKGFYPTALAKYADITLKDAYKLLLEKTESGELSLVWELRCPNTECYNKIKEGNKELDLNHIDCDKCGNEFEAHEIDYYPRFDINQEYKEFIKSEETKNSKKKSLTWIA